MGLFSAATQTRFLNEGEDLFNTENPSILDRLSLTIIAGTNLYALPDYVVSIKRVTWLGWKIDAIDQRSIRETNLTGNETGTRPYNYVYNNIGQLSIQFFPTPSQSYAAVTGPTLWGSDIINTVIVEFWRTSDHSSFLIPTFFRSRLLSSYQSSKLFALEGRGQDLKSAKYHAKKWLFLKYKYANLMAELQQSPGRTIFGNSTIDSPILTPHLPFSRFGIGVREGE